MPVCVKNETGRLKKVLLHRPGTELEQIVPQEMERLLFDDIPYLKTAAAEHDLFAETLKRAGAEVVYLEDLMAEVLSAGDELRSEFLSRFISEGGCGDANDRALLQEYLMSIEDGDGLVKQTMAGVRAKDIPGRRRGPLACLLEKEQRFLLDPIPNLYFTRDPFAVIGRGVSLHRMYSKTRRRETIYGEFILKYHPLFKDVPLYYDRKEAYSLEGGDILNLSEETLAVGISQRSAPEAVERLAGNLFADEGCSVRKVLAFYIPGIRAFMHLDTVFTQVDADKFVVHPGILSNLRVFELTPDAPGRIKVNERTERLQHILEEVCGQEKVTLISCGGGDRIDSEREQWNDGSNTLCVAPGTVVTYDRNYVTNNILRDHGVKVLEVAGSELSRGRGGPRCMSMPLERSDSRTGKG